MNDVEANYQLKFELAQLHKNRKRQRKQKLVACVFVTAACLAFHFEQMLLGQFIAYFGLIILSDVK